MMHLINSKNITLTISSSLRSSTVSKKFVKDIANWIPIISNFALGFVKESGGKHIYLNLMICGDYKVKRLNKEYRNKDKTTDVLSFPVYENLRSDKKSDKEQLFGPVDLGDIVVSWPVVLKQAVEFNVTNEQELIHLFVHGFLHLMGFDHELSRKEEIIMEKYEQTLVKKIYKKI